MSVNNKIKITYDDLKDPKVDEVITEQIALKRKKGISDDLKKGWVSFINKKWLYLLIAGLIGTVLVWGLLKAVVSLTTPKDRIITVGTENYVLSKEAQKYLKVYEVSDYKKTTSVIIIEEPHFSLESQFSLYKGLEVFFRDNPALINKTIFLSEGLPSNQPISVQPLIDVNPSPDEELIKEVLSTFLITGYIAHVWKYQNKIPIVGIEDKNIYLLSSRLWVEIQYNKDDQKKITLWNFTVAARNKSIANTLIEKIRTYQNPILFVGGLHLRKQSDNDFQRIKYNNLESLLSSEELVLLNATENFGIYDYLKQEKIGYTFIVPIPNNFESPKDSEKNINKYTELFKSQQNGDYSGYIETLISERSLNKSVTVAPSTQAAAQYLAASANSKANNNGEKDKKEKKKDNKKKNGKNGDGKNGDGKKGEKEGDKRHTPEQQEVAKDAKDAKKKGGVTVEEAKNLVDRARKAGLPARGPESHPNRPQGKDPHIHVGPVDHIPVK